MPGLKDITNIWKNIREIDLRPIREEAEQPLEIAIVGAPGSGRHTLAEQLRSDPAQPQAETLTPVVIASLETPGMANNADLIILLVDATQTDFTREQDLVRGWSDLGKKVLTFYNKFDLVDSRQAVEQWRNWGGARLVHGSANKPAFLQHEFVPVLMEMLPDKHLALGRLFPLTRLPIATELINETCFSNAAYAFSTGIAEIVPALGLPLNIADMIILTKAQAFMVYKLGLALGLSTEWRDYVTEFSSVIGGGFLWRQLARQLVGMIPIWGVIPKVAVSYAGTYAVGHAVLHWYLTGRHISRQQMRELYGQALARGKNFARTRIARKPRAKLPRVKPAELEAVAGGKGCSNCGRQNALDALYCQYCGQVIEPVTP